jgi:biotin carboxylase
VTRPPERPLLLVIGAGDRRYREYILASAARRYRLWLLSTEPISWHAAYLVGSSQIDPHDLTAALSAAKDAAAAQGSPAGILCYDEWLVHDAARLARKLGLPGPDPMAVAACRDKSLTRALLHAGGVPQPASIAVASIAQAHSAAREIGYPVILKARALAGSIGVVRVDSPELLEEAFVAARAKQLTVPQPSPSVLVEQYLTGPEISIDAAMVAGTLHILVLARKSLGFSPYFEEVGHTVSAADPLLGNAELSDQLSRIHRVLGIDHTVTHSEFRLTPDGPRLVEINARLGGDFIPRLGQLASGIDVAQGAADLAAGRQVDCTPTSQRSAGIRFFYPDQDCLASSAEVLNGRPASIESLVATVTAGQRLCRPPRGFLARYGYAVAVADQLDEVHQALTDSQHYLRLHAEPLAS